MKPDNGGRLELKLTDGSTTTARYALSIFSPQSESNTVATVDAVNGKLDLAEWDGAPPPAWLDALARSVLRSICRNRVSAGEWPRRITRWRPEPHT